VQQQHPNESCRPELTRLLEALRELGSNERSRDGRGVFATKHSGGVILVHFRVRANHCCLSHLGAGAVDFNLT